MPITQEHEIHTRRLSRNMGVGLALAALVTLVFGLTVVKVKLLDPAVAAAEVRQ